MRRRDVSPHACCCFATVGFSRGGERRTFPPIYPGNSNCILLPSLCRVFWEDWDPWDPTQRGEPAPTWKLRAVPLANATSSSRSIAPQFSLSALAESLETILPTCTPGLSELFKDTRIFLLHSYITWLTNAGRLVAAATLTSLADAGAGLQWGGTHNSSSWGPDLQWGLATGTSPSGTLASRKARSCAAVTFPSHAAVTFWGLLVGRDGMQAVL